MILDVASIGIGLAGIMFLLHSQVCIFTELQHGFWRAVLEFIAGLLFVGVSIELYLVERMIISWGDAGRIFLLLLGFSVMGGIFFGFYMRGYNKVLYEIFKLRDNDMQQGCLVMYIAMLKHIIKGAMDKKNDEEKETFSG